MAGEATAAQSARLGDESAWEIEGEWETVLHGSPSKVT